MTKLEDALSEYVTSYSEVAIYEISKKALRDTVQPYYERQEEKVFKFNGLIMKEASRKGREFKSEIVDFLEDRGLLPFAVSINKSMANRYNLEKAKINQSETLKLYAGGVQFIDRIEVYEEFKSKVESLPLKKLTEAFKENYSKAKLAEVKLNSKKQNLMQRMKEEGVYGLKCELGTLRIEETFDLDVEKIFDFVSGKKEMYVKRVGLTGPAANIYEVLFLPDQKKATLPKTLKFVNGQTLEEIMAEKPLDSSIYIKKGAHNKLTKQGYKAFAFEIELNPMEFFRDCKLSFGKIEELIDNGLLDPREVDSFIRKDPDKDVQYFELMTEASNEKRREMFDIKLLKRAQNFDYAPAPSSPFEHIELEAFSF